MYSSLVSGGCRFGRGASLDSPRELRASVSRGSDTPPGCHSLPLSRRGLGHISALPPTGRHSLPKCRFATVRVLACKTNNPRKSGGCRFGRGARTRTQDQRFWRPRFYQLNYTPVSLGSDTVHCNISFCLWQALFHFFLQKCFGNAAAENRSTVNRGDMPQTRLITPQFKQFYKDFS